MPRMGIDERSRGGLRRGARVDNHRDVTMGLRSVSCAVIPEVSQMRIRSGSTY
jgi:hypothetical protein